MICNLSVSMSCHPESAERGLWRVGWWGSPLLATYPPPLPPSLEVVCVDFLVFIGVFDSTI
jgi:hypothetical protein